MWQRSAEASIFAADFWVSAAAGAAGAGGPEGPNIRICTIKTIYKNFKNILTSLASWTLDSSLSRGPNSLEGRVDQVYLAMFSGVARATR